MFLRCSILICDGCMHIPSSQSRAYCLIQCKFGVQIMRHMCAVLYLFPGWTFKNLLSNVWHISIWRNLLADILSPARGLHFLPFDHVIFIACTLIHPRAIKSADSSICTPPLAVLLCWLRRCLSYGSWEFQLPNSSSIWSETAAAAQWKKVDDSDYSCIKLIVSCFCAVQDTVLFSFYENVCFLSFETFKMVFSEAAAHFLYADWHRCFQSCMTESMLEGWGGVGWCGGWFGGRSSQQIVQLPTPPHSQLHQSTCHPEQPSNAIRGPPPSQANKDPFQTSPCCDHTEQQQSWLLAGKWHRLYLFIYLFCSTTKAGWAFLMFLVGPVCHEKAKRANIKHSLSFSLVMQLCVRVWAFDLRGRVSWSVIFRGETKYGHVTSQELYK